MPQKQTKRKVYGTYIFAKIKGRANLVCFKYLASYLVYEKWYTERKTNTANKSKRIIQTAPKIIMNDMYWQNHEAYHYTTTATIENIQKGETIFPKLCSSFFLYLSKNNCIVFLLDKL